MKKRPWFTLIEMLIAISVFGIGILVVLQFIVHNLSVVDTTKQKTTATLLAKEWIELVYNMRDANLYKYLKRDCVLNNKLYSKLQNEINSSDKICDKYFASGLENHEVLQVAMSWSNYISATWAPLESDFLENFDTHRLYEQSGNLSWYPTTWLSHNSEGKTWRFARYIIFTWINEDGDMLPLNKLIKVESHVFIGKWGYTWEIVLESFIWNY